MRILAWLSVIVALAAGGVACGSSDQHPASSRHVVHRVGSTFAGRWAGHDRFLEIDRTGVGRERIFAGCCHHVADVTLRLTRVSGTTKDGSATARVDQVRILDRRDLGRRNPVPRVGQTGPLRVRDGVLSEPFTGMSYCTADALTQPACGA